MHKENFLCAMNLTFLFAIWKKIVDNQNILCSFLIHLYFLCETDI